MYGGTTTEARRAERRERLLAAGLDLAGGEGWPAATVRAVCARAKLTARYFYESFPDREALLLALFDAIAEEAAGRVVEAVAAAPGNAEAKSGAAIGAFVDLLVEDPRKARIMFVEAAGEPALVARRTATLRSFAALVGAQAREFYGPPARDDRLVDTASFLLAGGLAELLLAWLDGHVRATRDELVADCATLFAAMGRALGGRARG